MLLPDIEFIRYRIHDFRNRHERRGEYVETKGVVAHGYPWKLRVFCTSGRFVSLFVRYAGEDEEFVGRLQEGGTPAGRRTSDLKLGDGVFARANFLCKHHKKCGEVRKYTHTNDWGFEEFLGHGRILNEEEGFLDGSGSLTIDVELQVCEKGPWRSAVSRSPREVWYPKETVAMLQRAPNSSSSGGSLTDVGNSFEYGNGVDSYSVNHLATLLFSSTEFADVTFSVSGAEFKAHKCVLAIKCRPLLDLVLDSEQSEDNNDDFKDNAVTTSRSRQLDIIEINDVKPKVFQTLLGYVYGVRTSPTNNNDRGSGSDGNGADDSKIAAAVSKDEAKNEHNDEMYATELLLAGNRFGCTHLKLYAESVLVDKHITIENSSEYLPLADSHSCALLKEVSMDLIASNPEMAMESPSWHMVEESSRLLTELLVHYNKTSKNINYHDDTDSLSTNSNDIDHLDVTSLRDRLEEYNLSCDGSREMLISRLKKVEEGILYRASKGEQTPSNVARGGATSSRARTVTTARHSHA